MRSPPAAVIKAAVHVGGLSTQDRGDHVTEARLYVRDVTGTCFRRRYTLFAENRVGIVTRDVQLHRSTNVDLDCYRAMLN